MSKEIDTIKLEVESSMSELKELLRQRNLFLNSINNLEKVYHKGEIKYIDYNTELKRILKGKTKEELLLPLNEKIYQVLNELESENYKIFTMASSALTTVLVKKPAFKQAAKPMKIGKLHKAEIKKPVEVHEKPATTAKPTRIIKPTITKKPKMSKPVKHKIPEEIVKRAKAKLIRPLEKIEGEVNVLKKDMIKKEAHTISKLGKIANVSVGKIGLKLNKKFPELLNKISDELAYANIKIVSKTYMNMMIFLTIITFIFVFFFTIPFTIADLFVGVMKSFFIALVVAGVVVSSFIAFPNMRIKYRTRSINTNMPFAINHIYAISSAGVPPQKIFKLISAEDEYGELSVEIKKINTYMQVLGYDLVSALKKVSSKTPSQFFKSFLMGFVTVIQTGGSLRSFLKQKSEEAILSYKLERQKYLSTIATYSDMYTGILVAAPLFFVTVLSLINMLGGTIGGVTIDVVMGVGTYLLIPILNIAFLTYLELAQPET